MQHLNILIWEMVAKLIAEADSLVFYSTTFSLFLSEVIDM